MATVNSKTELNSNLKKKNRTSTKERMRNGRLFGKIALKSNKITVEKLREGLIFQRDLKKQGIDKKIGEILVEKNYLSSSQVLEILKKQKALDLIRKREFSPAKKRTNKKKSMNDLVRTYKTGEVIFKENDASNYDLFVIQSGEIGVYKNSIHLGKRFDKGAFIGTTSCLLKTPRIATVVAMKESTLLRIPGDDVQTFFEKNPNMALKLSSVLAQRVSKLTNKYVDVVKELPDAAEKLHDSLLIDSAEGSSLNECKCGEPLFDEPLLEGSDSVVGEEKINATQELIAEKVANEECDKVCRGDRSEIQEEDNGMSLPDGNDREGETAQEIVEDSTVKDVSCAGRPQSTEVSNQEVQTEANSDDLPEEINPIDAVTVKPDSTVQLFTGELKEIIKQEKPIEISAEIKEMLERRLEIYVKLEDVAIMRDELEAREGTSDKAKNELASLRRELNKIPPYDRIEMKRDKLADLVAKAKLADDDAQAKTTITPDVVEAYEISVAQKKLLLQWYDEMPEILNVCSKVAAEQYMYKLMLKVGVNPNEVFGWAIYAMAMKGYVEELKEEQQRLRALFKKLTEDDGDSKSGGILSLFKKKQDVDEEEVAAKEQERKIIKNDESLCRIKMSGVNKELSKVEAIMVDAFWAVYGALGLRLVQGVDNECERYVRAYLRWGILGFAEDFINPEILEKLLRECDGGSKIEDVCMDANYMIYADEVIDLTAKKKLLPSPNEELEMNERNSPRWKLDRAHRRIVGGGYYLEVLRDLQEGLEEATEQKKAQREAKENEMNGLSEDDPDYKNKSKALKATVQTLKVAAVKSQKLVEKVRDEMMVKAQADVDAGKEAMDSLGLQIEPEDLARHEIVCIRRFSRLVAKLKEPFLPFTLKDRFDPEMKTTNTKEDVREVLKDIEEKDPLIFKENMLATMKRNNRVQVRTSPFVHLLPASGIMGFMVAPRTDTYSGKIMLPGYFERSGMREAVAVETLSDFRYDTSKEQAGTDVMNSDTLVAAYAEVRWVMRKKEKEVRQKAGIFTDENERTNWRRHYAMYIDSAFDGGKKLFFKCPDLYELVINKFIELPEGVEVLTRG